LSVLDQVTPEDQDTLKHMAKKRYRHAMPGDKKDEVLAKNVSINEKGMLHCLTTRRRNFRKKIVSTNVVIGLI